MDRGAWHATVYEVAKSWTQLSDWIELNKIKPFNAFKLGNTTLLKYLI